MLASLGTLLFLLAGVSSVSALPTFCPVNRPITGESSIVSSSSE
uniref:Uncharacterized protein MANES_18G076200 n=1 Tax=Rhizophora mucronata TaxID=61149 RepID=A0A2P2MDN7_RHIMU